MREPGRGQFRAAIALAHGLDGARVDGGLDPEGRGDGVRGHVVMGRADAASGEDIAVAGAELVYGGDDLGSRSRTTLTSAKPMPTSLR